VTPGGTKHCVQLFPLGGIQELVTPLLEGYRGRVVAWELVPGHARCALVWPGRLATLRLHPAAHHSHIIVHNLVTGSWHTTTFVYTDQCIPSTSFSSRRSPLWLRR